jgi:hypothetical protein
MAFIARVARGIMARPGPFSLCELRYAKSLSAISPWPSPAIQLYTKLGVRDDVLRFDIAVTSPSAISIK